MYKRWLVLVLLASFVFIGNVSALSYNFMNDGSLKEAGTMAVSTSPYWWVNSGGYMNIVNGRGQTNQGSLASTDPFRILYNTNNALDTDNGLHPQNIFRLVTKDQWKNIRQEAYFKINKDQFSTSWNRDVHNGLLLFNRYVDSNNLYYTGVRVDGYSIIKKKQNGVYTTLRAVPNIFPGTYDRATNPSLLPKNTWIGLRSEVTDNANGSVNIKLYMDKNWNNKWVLIAEVNDNTNPITQKGYGGIRTDFMDVTFDNFKADEI